MQRLAVELGVGEHALGQLQVDGRAGAARRAQTTQLGPGGLVESGARARRRPGARDGGDPLQPDLERALVIAQIGGAQRRHHPVRLQEIARRRNQPSPGHDQLAIVRQAQHGLHGALAVGRAADHDGASGILERGGHDLGGRGGAAVDQHHERGARGDAVARGGEILAARRMAPDRRYDRAVMDEQIGEADRLVEQPAGVAAQIEDDAGEAPAGLPLDVRQPLGDALGRAAVEAGDTKHRDVAVARRGHGRHRRPIPGVAEGRRAALHRERKTRTATALPTGPRSWWMTSSCERPTVATPSIATIWSSGRMPARSAGPCGADRGDAEHVSVVSSVMPIPPKPSRAAR